MTEGDLELATQMRSKGYSCAYIATSLGVSANTIARWLNPEYAERLRRSSREAKRRRTGTCLVCGGTTRYAGKGLSSVSPVCANCRTGHYGPRWSAERRGRGRIIGALIELLSANETVTFPQLIECIERQGGAPKSIAPLLYQRLIPYGFAVRVSRGVYAAGPALGRGQ